MITANEAKQISEERVQGAYGNQLLEGVEALIRLKAKEGYLSVTLESNNLTDADKSFLWKKLTEQGFSILETSMTICW